MAILATNNCQLSFCKLPSRRDELSGEPKTREIRELTPTEQQQLRDLGEEMAEQTLGPDWKKPVYQARIKVQTRAKPNHLKMEKKVKLLKRSAQRVSRRWQRLSPL
jgi:hypothetical protein